MLNKQNVVLEVPGMITLEKNVLIVLKVALDVLKTHQHITIPT